MHSIEHERFAEFYLKAFNCLPFEGTIMFKCYFVSKTHMLSNILHHIRSKYRWRKEPEKGENFFI